MTTLFLVAEALIAAIEAQAAAAVDESLHDLQVTFGHPGRDIELEGVIVAETVDEGERAPAGLASLPAAVPIDERYTLTCKVEVTRQGGRAVEAAQRATTIVELVEAACEQLSIPPLTVPEVVTVELRRLQLRNAFSGEGRSAVYGCEVDVHARV